MSRDVKIAACLIVRDAEADLAWCLGSLSGEVDEIVVVDTGSQDATRSIARRFTKHVFSHAWQDDFAAARNFALSKAHGTWAFCIDSDECLAGEKGALRRAVLGAEGLGEKALSLLRREVDEEGHPVGLPDNPAVRLLRRGGGLAYHDAIHEVLEYPDGRGVDSPLVPSDELFLYHRGYAPARRDAKTARNLRILEDLEDAGVKKTYLHFYLANCYDALGRYEDVCREAELSLTAREHPVQGALELWRVYMTALEKRGRMRDLQELCERARDEVPDLPDTYARLGVAAMNRGDFAEGERRLLEALAREKVFQQACPYDYNTFHAVLPQVQELLAECRTQLGERSVQEGDSERSKEATDVTEEETSESEPATHAKQEEEQAAESRLGDLVPSAAATVVLFGCGRGAAGELLLCRNPAMRIYGFALTREEAVAAGHVLTAAFVGTPETAELGHYGLAGIDCIAYDVAACGVLTTSALRRHAEVLAPDGQMVLYFSSGAAKDVQRLTQSLRGVGFETVLAVRQKEDVVVRAVRQAVPMCSVQTMVGESTVTARMRVWTPDAFCGTAPGWFFRSAGPNTINARFAAQMNASIVIRQRTSFSTVEHALEAIQFFQKGGHLTVYELDDNPVLWKKKLEASKYLDFRGVHAVQVSTPALADYVRQYNPHVFLFENQLKELPEERDYAAEAKARDGRVTIFFGAVNREAEWQEIVPLLNQAAAKYGDCLQFEILADVPSFEALHAPHKHFVGDRAIYDGKFVPYDVYTKALHMSDIALLPLRDNAFNRMKSDLKFIESAGHGAVVLASPTVYERTVVDGCTGCIYHNPEEFSEKLARLIEDASYRHAIAEAAYGYVRKHRLLSQHYMERIRAYTWLIEHREELDRELEERLKEI